MEDFVKIVKRADSIKIAGREKNLKLVKRAALLIGSLKYVVYSKKQIYLNDS